MDASTFAARRKRFLDALPARSLALFRAAPIAIRSADVEFPYRQDNDFFYLTGFPEPEAICLLDPQSPEPFTLFVRPRDPERETWTGRRWGAEGAREHFGASAAFTIDKFDELFPARIDDRQMLFFSFGRDEAFNRRILEQAKRSQAMRSRTGAAALAIVSPDDVVHEMRLRKEPGEVDAMRRAAEITAVAHREALAATRPGVGEHEVEAVLAFAFRRLGGSGPAYPPIVASGENATVLHYVENTRRMEDGDLLLIDAGAEFDQYCCDVTRTYPVGRKYGSEQKQVYEIVLEAQRRAIESVAPGVSFEAVHEKALRVLVDGLRELEAVAGSTDEVIEQGTYRPFYMHRTSHWLGMDVHDVGKYRSPEGPRRLEPGMVLTVEPGLYFAGATAPERLRGIGVRIEDDVLVTQDAQDVLTRAIPKAVDEIEALR
jgi:Xaa-Pro aminopeptidase